MNRVLTWSQGQGLKNKIKVIKFKKDQLKIE